ncbi:TetR/AcrR family transcriptional regulator [Micromonospora sp. NPDC093277]|uniref:TetR/AcrR family transcriptional regulator n=1 Tax=Micromonospora sp. NPDC093277 TaxID=3364291 RepID=UPI0038065312
MSELPARRRQRADARRSSATVLNAAIELLGRRPEASMDDIASAAGVARQTVYAHYPSRKALITAIVDRLTTETAEALAGIDANAGSATDALRAWLEESWRLMHRYPVLLTPAIAAVEGGDSYERHIPIMDTLLPILERGRRDGEFDAAQPVHWYVSAIVALGHAAGQEVIAERMSVTAAGLAFRAAALRVGTGRQRCDHATGN